MSPDATPSEIRSAYRSAVRRFHPDLSSRTDASTIMAELNDAYRVLRHPGSESEPATIGADPPIPTYVEPDGLTMIAPRDEVFDRLIAACDQVGTVVGSDPDDGYIEAVIEGSPDRAPCQLVVSLQGRAHGVEAFFTLESLDPRITSPCLSDLVRTIAGHVNRQS